MPKNRTRSYRHLTQADRDRLQALRDTGTKQRDIARILTVDPATICREISRNRRKYRRKKHIKNRHARYEAGVANHKAYVRRKYAKYQGKKIEEDVRLRRYVASRLRRSWNPDEIAGKMKETHMPFYASKTTMYEWLRSVWGQRYVKYLYSKRCYVKRRKPKTVAQTMIPNRVSIHERPAYAATEYGHYEVDTFVSGRNTGSSAAVAIAVETKADYLVMKKLRGMRPKPFAEAVRNMRRTVIMKSATLDNGIENRDHEAIGTSTFFCDPYSSWQKPHVENGIRLVRWFIPKGSDISQVSETKIARIARILNHKPRKSLGYKTPYEVMVEQELFSTIAQENIALRG